jgi:F0F1-type ATP synthase assembly protein I
MAESIFEKADAQVAESVRKLSRATSAMADAINESAGVIQRVVKQSSDVVEDLMEDTANRMKRHPAETMAVTFMLGVMVGGFIGWMISRRYISDI